jgi:hypothetical protein
MLNNVIMLNEMSVMFLKELSHNLKDMAEKLTKDHKAFKFVT